MTPMTTRRPIRSLGLYKTEVIHRRGPWKCLDDVVYATLEWVAVRSTRRILKLLGRVSPSEFRT